MDERHVYDGVPLQGQSLLRLQLCCVSLQVLGEHLGATGTGKGTQIPTGVRAPNKDTGVRTTFSFSQFLP